MNNENQTVDMIEDTQNDSAEGTVDLSQMDREQLEAYAIKQAKAYADQKGRAEKLKAKLDTPVEKTEVEKVETVSIAPEVAETKNTPLDTQYEIAQLSSKFSLEEIKEAQSLIGTPFGKSLSEVSVNPGFLAHINAKRELTKSDSMISNNPIVIDSFQSKKGFVQEVELGNIDITVDKEAYKKYVQIKAEEQAGKF